MAAVDPEIAGGGAIRMQVVPDQSIGNEAVFFQKFAHQFQRAVLVSLGLDQHIDDFAFGVGGPPQTDHAASDFQTDFVQTPSCVGFGAASTQIRSNDRPETVYPAPDRLA